MSNINTQATVTLNVNGKEAAQTLDNLKKKSQDLESAIEKAAKAGDKATLKKLQRELKATNKKISDIESATIGVEKVLKNLDRATPKELKKTLSTLKKELDNIERGTKEWEKQCEAIKKVKAEINRVNQDLKEGETRLERFTNAADKWQNAFMAAAAAVTAFVMAGRSAVQAYAEMEGEMANVRKFTGMTEEQVAELNEEFKKMDTRTSREDLNKLAEEAGRLGKQSKEDVLGFVKAADQINVALDDLGEGATLTLSKLTSIFGDEEKLGTERALLAVGSVINELSQNCTASAPYLAQFAQRMAGIGAQANMTIPQIMGFAAVLDSQGQAVEMSATALSTLISHLFQNTDKIIKATGMNAKEFKDTLAKDTNAALLMLIQRLHDLGSIDVLAPVFKDMGETGARASSVFAALAGNIDKVKWEQEEANKAFEAATSVTGEFNVQNNTVQAGLDKAGKRLQDLKIELGQQLVPVMRHVISSTTLLLKAMKAVIDFVAKYKAEIAAVSIVLGTYAVAINLAAVRTKIATAATAAWNAVLKVGNILLPIAQVMVNGLKLAFERLIWQTRGANATQQAYNKSLMALKANATATKVAFGLLAVAIAAAAVAMVKWIKHNSEAAVAQRRLNEINEQANSTTAEEIKKINHLRSVIEDNTLSVDRRREAIKDLQKIVPSYHASIDTEGKLYNHNTKVLDIYIEKLKAAARVQAALAKLPEAEADRDRWFNDAPHNLQEAYFNQQVNGMSDAEAAASANASLAGYRAWKKGLAKREVAVNQYNDIIETETKRSEDLNAKMEADNGPAKGNPNDYVPAPTKTGSGSNIKSTEDRLKAEKDWKAKQEALNRIAYATGKQNYEQYTQRMLEIEEEYHEKILSRSDLTEQERLDAQVGFYESLKKEKDEEQKRTVEEESRYYNELVAQEKQRYIDGEVSAEVYQQTMELYELQHLKRMVSIYKEGTKEYQQANQAYQDRLIADQKKRQQETEKKEKEHQQRLAEIKKEYFGDNRQERMSKYMRELELVKLVYEKEIENVGNDEDEKRKIEKAMQKAKDLLKQKYNIDDNEENWLKKAEDDVNKWLKGPGDKWKKAFEMISGSMSAIFTQLTSLINAETEIQTKAIEKRYDAEVSKAEGNNYKIKKLEKKKQDEIAKIKNQANKKMYTMQVMEAVAQTATAAINAYSSAAAIKGIGWIIAPIAAAAAVAAGMIQVAAIKKQQQASASQGYAEGGFTGEGARDEVAGVVHKGEWVASQDLVNSPTARPMINALDYAQRNNAIGSLNMGRSAVASPMERIVVVQQNESNTEIARVISRLNEKLDEPFTTVNTVTGDAGIKKAQDDYDKMIRNKTPKKKR